LPGLPTEPADGPVPPPVKKPAAQPAPLADPFSSNDGGLRIWTDATGKYRVEARFVRVLNDDSIRLQKADGCYVRVALSRLSDVDQKFIRSLSRSLVMN